MKSDHRQEFVLHLTMAMADMHWQASTKKTIGEMRALEAAHQAVTSPLFEETSIASAKGVLINICGGTDLTLHEVNEASTIIREVTDEDANVIFGAAIDETLYGEIKVTILAAGSTRPQ